MSSRGLSISTNGKAQAPRGLAGRRILIVEDSPVVAPFCAEVLDDLGCSVIGPAPNMAAARKLLDEEQIDAAIMDVHIRGERVFPLCDLVAAKGIPFVLSSGYADWAMPEKWEDRPRLPKPYTIDEVEQALNALFAQSEG